MAMKQILITAVMVFFYVVSGVAQNTMKLEEGEKNPKAAIEDLAWLEGHWTTEALGGTAEEIWSGPKAGAMMGMFRSEREGEISFYEFFAIREVDESLLLQIKHFQRDLVGWEEKDETVDFPLVKLDGNKRTVWFDGLTMRLIDENHLTVYLRSENRDGTESELVFPYTRSS